jgi:Peptidase family M28
MLDPRIYRTGFVAVAVAAVVLAFSLYNQQGPLNSTLAPEAFNGQNAYTTMKRLAQDDPDRRPGTAGDDALAAEVTQAFRAIRGFDVSTSVFKGRTVAGTRTLETVTATRTGLSTGSIVVVAHRDALSSPATADLSGTATLLELARVLAGETQHRTIVLASTSGSAGAAGATALARSLGGPIDAVIALGDLAGTRVHDPIVVPWSNGQDVAPPLLRNTIAAALSSQAGLRPGGTSLAGQLAHLAFPLTVSEQGPFGARGQPAVLLSVGGERGASPNEVPNPNQITVLGRAVLQTVSALDSGPEVPAASSYLLYAGKVIPDWAVKLLVLALILPVLGATIDGLARARRRGHSITRWTVWVLAGALPFLLALLVVLSSRLTGLIDSAPPGPVAAGAVPLHSSGVALLAIVAVVIILSFLVFRPLMIGLVRAVPGGAEDLHEPANQGAAAALLLVMCVVSVAIWVANPFAAALIIPALHLWMWVVDPEVRLRPAASLALLLVGLAPPVLVIIYYAHSLGLGPIDVLWNGVLLIAGGHVALLSALEWSIVLGCAVAVLVIGLRELRQPLPDEAPVTVRGPITYAGPGSLGGTESALRR